jgi:hypothetical protein
VDNIRIAIANDEASIASRMLDDFNVWCFHIYERGTEHAQPQFFDFHKTLLLGNDGLGLITPEPFNF